MLKSLVLSAFISFSALAGHLDQVCENYKSVTWEDNLISYRAQGETMITTHSGMIIASIPYAVKGIFQHGISIWALTKDHLLELNSAGDIMNEYLIEWTGNPRWQALSMVKAGNMIVISRGAGGLLGFDLTKRDITWTNWMSGNDEGQPSGLAFDGKKLYAAVATSQEKGFTGIAVVNPENGAITKRSRYDVARWGVIGVDASARIHGENLILNNGGWIHVITKKQIESDKAIRPRWAALVIPQDGPVTSHYMMMNSDFVIHGDQVMGCGTYTSQEEGVFVRKTKLFHVKLL